MKISLRIDHLIVVCNVNIFYVNKLSNWPKTYKKNCQQKHQLKYNYSQTNISKIYKFLTKSNPFLYITNNTNILLLKVDINYKSNISKTFCIIENNIKTILFSFPSKKCIHSKNGIYKTKNSILLGAHHN